MSLIPVRMARTLFWLAVSLSLGGSVALDFIVAPTVFLTNRRVGVVVPNLPPQMNAPNFLGGQIFGGILANFAPVFDGCLVVIIIFLLLEGLPRLRRLGMVALVRLLLLIPLVAVTIFFAVAAAKVTHAFADWELYLRQGMAQQAAAARSTLDWWHNAATNIEVVKLLCLAAIAVLSAWSLPSKSQELDPDNHRTP